MNKMISCCLMTAVVFYSLLAGCAQNHEVNQTDSTISIDGDRIIVKTDAPFFKHLEVAEVLQSDYKNQELGVVGQIIALANYSDELVGAKIAWSELDPELSKSLGLFFNANTQGEVGEAFGVVSVLSEYCRQLSPGQTIKVWRYGLKSSGVIGQVVSIKESVRKGASSRIIFRISNSPDWCPGTNCEVAFPMNQGQVVSVPTTALLHEGSQEYLLEEIVQGQYVPRPVYILRSTPDIASILGQINPGQKIVSRGAILLKPLLHSILRTQEEASQERKVQ